MSQEQKEGTRRLIMSSWSAAKRVADTSGYVHANAASCAGQYLELANGDAVRALAMLPTDGFVFWTRVRGVLEQVRDEELRQAG